MEDKALIDYHYFKELNEENEKLKVQVKNLLKMIAIFEENI